MFKRENLRKDQVIIKCIKLMDLLLKKEGTDMCIRTYSVVPVSPVEGFIEFVKGETLTRATEKGQSISMWMYDHSKISDMNAIRQRFLTSTAAWTVIVYLLGIGDRHTENLLVKVWA